MESIINSILIEFADDVKKIIGPNLKRIILYGSYARGDNTLNSDIDVMILVSLNDDEIRKIRDDISDCAFEFLMQYGVDISPAITSINHFEYWVDTLPFYRNVRDEGVVLSA